MLSLFERLDRAGVPALRHYLAERWLSTNEVETLASAPVARAARLAIVNEQDAARAILNQMLTPLSEYYTHVDVEEIVMNRPQEVWLKNRRVREGLLWERVEAPHLTFEIVRRIISVVANVTEQPFGEDSVPTVYAELPGGHRFTAAMGKIVDYDGSDPRGSLVLAIRQAPRKDIKKVDYESYGLEAGKLVEPVFKVSDETMTYFGSMEILQQAMREETHVLISGGTATGKTTLLDRMIEDLPLTRRVATVEDTRELRFKHPNRFHVVLPRTETTRHFDEKAATNLLTRMTPDVIIAGELSTRNAGLILNLTGTGHGAMMTTIHAESPELAIERFTDLVTDSRSSSDPKRVAASIRGKFLIIQLKKVHGTSRRQVTEIRLPEITASTSISGQP